MVQQLKSVWLNGFISFYDPYTFTGWPAFQFYGFIPHLIAVILSYPLGLFTENPERLSVNLLVVFGLASLPFSFYYATKPFINELFDNFDSIKFKNNKNTILLFYSLSIVLFYFWYLNHDYRRIGLGADAILYVGLYSQLFGWHAILFYIGSLVRFIIHRNKKSFLLTSIAFSLVFLTHNLSAIYCSMIFFFSILWFDNLRIKLLKTHLLGLSLISFWLIPLINYSSDYTIYNIIYPQDIIHIIFGYSLIESINTLKEIIKGNYIPFNFTYILIWFLLISLFINKHIKNASLLKYFILILLLIFLLLSSSYIISTIPIGIHYNRIQGLNFLLLLIILPVVLLSWLKSIFINTESKMRFVYLSLIALAITICFINNMFLPHLLKKVIYESNIRADYRTQDKIIEYFKNIDIKGRVLIEPLSDYKQFPPIFGKYYLPTSLINNSDNEVILNIFVQQSLAYRLLATNLNQLGSSTIESKITFGKDNIISDEQTVIGQFKDFGISHIIAGTKKFKDRLNYLVNDDPIKIDNYSIYKLNDDFQKINKVEKMLIGFIDVKSNINFSHLVYYFYSHKELTRKYELINISNDYSDLSNFDLLLVNISTENIDNFQNEIKINSKIIDKTIYLDYNNNYRLINHYKPYFSNNLEYDKYIVLSDYLANNRYFIKQVRSLSIKNNNNPINDDIKPELLWGEDNQNFTLRNLIPGNIYRINYSYFPYWHTTDGILYRGSKERMYFRPNKDNAQFKYSKFYSLSSWVGWFFTILGTLYLCYLCNINNLIRNIKDKRNS